MSADRGRSGSGPNRVSEPVLDGRLIVNVAADGRGREYVYIGSETNHAGSMKLTALELAALLDGPLQRALEAINRDG